MNERLQRIAHDLEYDTYKDPTHGKIARDNFIYGVAQAKIECKEKAKKAFCDTCMGRCEDKTHCDTLQRYINALEE